MTRSATKHYNDDNLPAGVTGATFRAYEQADRLAGKYADKRTALKAKILAAFGSGTHEYNGVTVTNGEQNNLDAKAFAKAHPVEKFPQYYKFALDVKSVPAEAREGYITVVPTSSVK